MFTHLHVHSEYSLLDGMCRAPVLLARAKELGMASLALTDHGAMYGAIEFYLAAQEAGIKPIIGCEVYVAAIDHRERTPADRSPFHLVLLAENQTGYRNLLQLVTKAHTDGFYYRPRVDRSLLAEHSKGLVALSACLQGELARLILEGRLEDAERSAAWHRDTFAHYYLELQQHEVPELAKVNRELAGLSRKLGIPLVATNDVHYVAREDAQVHDLLLCIGTNTTIYDERRMRLADDSFCLKSHDEMAALFSELPEAVGNTEAIAQMCDLKLEFGRLHLPEFPTEDAETPDEYLARLCREGLKRRYPEVTEAIERRLDYELDVIRKTHFANYFLVVWDFAAFARERNILFGLRGSAAASLVLYCLGVSDVDPLAHRLVFERFLNVERKEMPDIDMDFAEDRRDEVIAYVAQRWGAGRVAQIITFGTLGARAALRDVGRALGMPYGDVDRVARLVPAALNMTLDRALDESQELATTYANEEPVKYLVDTAKRLEGIVRHASTHAAGLVISKEPLVKHVPLQRPARAEGAVVAMTQYAMEPIARIGLLKMDVLGLANLSILQRTVANIERTRRVTIDLRALPLDDAKAFELLAAGETAGVFQLEGPGMRRFIKELRPTSFGDIAAMVALYRPGPMQHIPTFIKAKHGLEPIRYPHPALAEILEETYGVIVYQDQVLLIAQAFAGYSLGRADIVRKAMGKKIPAVMREERRHFLAGAKSRGFDEKVAGQVFDLIEPFAGYAFNKAHSVSYAVIAYQTAYLKANYPVEYMTALLELHSGDTEKVASAVAECRRLGIRALPPDVNKSGLTFQVEALEGGELAVRFGLADVKNVGAGAVAPLLEAREQGGPFRDIDDLASRADLRAVNKRVLESLIKTGALDALGTRGALLAGVDRVIALSQRQQKLKESGQATMFDLWGQSVSTPMPGLELGAEDVPPSERLGWEKELLGVYLSEHPFTRAARRLAQTVTVLCGQVGEDMAGQNVTLAGVVQDCRTLSTREGRTFAAATLEDLDGTVEVTAWPDVYETTRDLWEPGRILLVEGRVRVRNGRVGVACVRAQEYQELAEYAPAEGPPAARSAAPRRLIIVIDESEDVEADEARLEQVLALLGSYPGQDRARLLVRADGREVSVAWPEGVRACEELARELSRLVGSEAVRLETIA